MAMTLRLTESDDAALTAAAQREHISKHEVVVRALRTYTGGRQERIEAATRLWSTATNGWAGLLQWCAATSTAWT